jgi:hypothetical protein
MSLIKNRNKVKQVIDFSGVQNGKLHPSDIDGVFEFDNRVLILMEVKRKYKAIPTGQRLLLERISDSWHTKENSIVLKVEHEWDDEHTSIPLKGCVVSRAYYKEKWITYKEPMNILDYLNKLGEEWECKKCRF